MREIKFRAWIKNADKMVDVIAIDFEKEEICWIFDDYVNWEQERVWIGFDDIALMQYTGLKDKNGNEIYEDDILKTWIGGYEQASPYVVEDMRKLYFELNRDDSYYRIQKTEILGNIYENPELLEED